MMYKVVIVDDEEVGRLRLGRLISENFNDITIVGEASNGILGAEIILKTKPDLVFLDIEMPGMSGIDVANACCNDIFVIFVTAYDQYVFDAFRTLAVDYILKPIEVDNLRRAINKFKKIYTPMESNALLNLPEPSVRTCRLKITVGTITKFLTYDEIIYFEAYQKYTTVFTVDLKNYIVDQTLLELENSLSQEFLRIHRKYIVNENYISEIKRLGDRKFKAVLKNPIETELIVGRHYLSNIKKL